MGNEQIIEPITDIQLTPNKVSIISSPSSDSSSNSNGKSVTNSGQIENDLSYIELDPLKAHNHDIQQQILKEWSEVDSVKVNGSVTYFDIISTTFSITMRAITVGVNIKLALNYYKIGQFENFLLTVICIILPMLITTLIYANMCHQDGKFSKGTCKSLKTLWLVFLSSFLFRYWMSLVYSIKCKKAELRNDKEQRLKYFKKTVREESDVAFIRLFECFLEAAPQKILQISIVLAHVDKITKFQIIAICSYFGSMAWCLAAYHRCNRFAQIDKHNIKLPGLLLQLCWHFCISVSRTLCIAYVASVFPLWTLVACICHSLFLGCITFIVDRPNFAATTFLNFIFCCVLGFVYVFIYIAVKDAPTRLKYILYYILCFSENIVCIIIFILFASANFVSLAFLFYPLCAITLAFYPIGILFMIIYYLYYHPKITARKSKRLNSSNK